MRKLLTKGFASIDLRDPDSIPLNFTKSINLALSERGIHALRQTGRPELLENIMTATIPMRGRMIHGRGVTGALYEEAQDYDIFGRVRFATVGSLRLFP